MTTGLRAFYGPFTHSPGEAYPRLVEITPVLSERGRRWATDVQITLEGQFCDDPVNPLTRSQIANRIEQLDEAYKYDYRDFGFMYKNDGDSAWALSPHYIRHDAASNLTGNKVLRRSWLHREPTEFANTRSYNVTVGARFRESYSSIIDFKEAVTFRGDGGPDWVYRTKWQGNPRRDDLTEKTVVHVIQTGYHVNLFPLPLVNPPLFPEYVLGKQTIITRTTPKSHGSNLSGRYSHYAVQWVYHMYLDNVTIYQPPNFYNL
jgi:hypothetical protein